MKKPQSIVLPLLGTLFVGLKLTGYIDWSWWWVTLPFWGGLAIFCTFLAGVGIVAGIVHLSETPEERARRKLAKSFGDLADALDRRK